MHENLSAKKKYLSMFKKGHLQSKKRKMRYVCEFCTVVFHWKKIQVNFWCSAFKAMNAHIQDNQL